MTGDLLIDLDSPRGASVPRQRRPVRPRAALAALVTALAVALGGPEAVIAEPRFGQPVSVDAGSREFTLTDDAVYVLGADVTAYGLSDGRRRWTTSVPGLRPVTLLDAGGVALVVGEGRAVAVDARSGAELWQVDGRPLWAGRVSGGRIAMVHEQLVGHETRVQHGVQYVVRQSVVTVRDAATGRLLYEREMRDLYDTLLIGYGRGGAEAVGLVLGDGQRKALVGFDTFAERPMAGAPTGAALSIVDGTMIVHRPGHLGDGTVQAFDAATYAHRWQRRIDASSVQPCGAYVCVTGIDGTVALDRATGSVRSDVPGSLVDADGIRSGVDVSPIIDSPGAISIMVVDTGSGEVLRNLSGRWSGLQSSPLRFGDRVPVIHSELARAPAPAHHVRIGVFDVDRLTEYPLGTVSSGAAAACRATATHVACPPEVSTPGMPGEIWIWRYAG